MLTDRSSGPPVIEAMIRVVVLTYDARHMCIFVSLCRDMWAWHFRVCLLAIVPYGSRSDAQGKNVLALFLDAFSVGKLSRYSFALFNPLDPSLVSGWGGTCLSSNLTH